MHLRSLLPDYLILAPNMTNNLTSNRQAMRRLESLVSACDELAIKAVLPSDDADGTVAVCREMGFDLVLQSASRQTASHDAQLMNISA